MAGGNYLGKLGVVVAGPNENHTGKAEPVDSSECQRQPAPFVGIGAGIIRRPDQPFPSPSIGYIPKSVEAGPTIPVSMNLSPTFPRAIQTL